jgi:hypothetical protein
MDSGNAAFFAFQVVGSNEVLFALGLLPTGLSAFSRLLLGWEEPQALRAPADVVTLSPANSVQPVGPRVARLDVSADEYFLVENRRDLLYEHPDDIEPCPYLNRDDATGVVLWMSRADANQPPRMRRNSGEYDFFIASPTAPAAELGECGQTGFGLLVWQVDERVIADGYAFNEVNANEDARGLRLIEASGDYEIGDWRAPTVSFLGDGWNDPFRAGFRTTLTATTVPNNWNSDWAHTGWEITDVRFAPPESHELSVRVVDGVAGWPRLLRTPLDSLPPLEPRTAVLVPAAGGTTVIAADSAGVSAFDAGSARRLFGGAVQPTSLAFHPRLAPSDAAGTLGLVDSARVWLFDATPAGDSLAVRAGFPVTVPDGCGGRLSLVGADPALPQGGALVETGSGAWVLVDAVGVGRTLDADGGREADPVVGPVARNGEPGVALVGRDVVAFVPLDISALQQNVAHGLGDADVLVAGGKFRGSDTGAAPVVVLHRDGRLRVVDADRGVRTEYPDLPADRYLGVALADLTGDGELDVVAASASRVAGVTSRGARLLNTPLVLRDAFAVRNPLEIVAAPMVADVAGDSLPEILVTTDRGLVYALDANGHVVDGYPRKMLPDRFPAAIYAADVDADGAPEIFGLSSIAANAAAPPGGSLRAGWTVPGGDFARTRFATTPGPLQSPAATRLQALERPLVAYPNPARDGMVQLRMTASRPGPFTVAIYTLEGERVFEQHGTLAAGTQEIAWRCAGMAPGVYVCRFVSEAAGIVEPMTAPITLVR